MNEFEIKLKITAESPADSERKRAAVQKMVSAMSKKMTTAEFEKMAAKVEKDPALIKIALKYM